MFKLTKGNKVIFEGHFDVLDTWVLEDKSRYSLYIRTSVDITCELFINDKLCRLIDIDAGQTGCITFKTNISDDIKVRRYPRYVLPE